METLDYRTHKRAKMSCLNIVRKFLKDKNYKGHRDLTWLEIVEYIRANDVIIKTTEYQGQALSSFLAFISDKGKILILNKYTEV
jgi:hypothetical protein